MPLRSSNHLKEILLALSKDNVEYIICGGVAAALHGVERMTLDLDLSVSMEPDNLKRFLRVMKKLKLKPRVPVPADSLLDPEQRRMMIDEKNALVFTFLDIENPFRQVDFFLTDEFSFDRLYRHTDELHIGRHTVKLLSKEKLVEMKRAIEPVRDKDMFDINVLEKLIKEEGPV